MAKKKQTNVKQQLQEYFKCKRDPIYFIENYVQLELPGGNQLMKMYKPQKRFLRTLLADHHVIALKSRQIGISTLAQAYIVYTCTFYKNAVIGVVSRDGAESTDFCRKVMSMLQNLPPFLRPKFKKDTEQTFILDNGCKFYASQVNASNPGALFRGKAITIAVIDEAAFINKVDEAYTGMAPALMKSQKVAASKGVPFGTLIISTPNRTVGMGKWYYQRWAQAQERETIFVPEKIHWTQVKEFRDDPNWYKTQCELLGNIQWKIDQELEMKFVASSNSFFDSDIILKLNDSEEEPRSVLNVNRYQLRQYVQPDPNKFYLIGVDTASEAGPDYSAIQVVDYETFEQCAEFKDHLRVDEFCKVIDLVNKIYPNNMLVVESNSYGNQVVEFLTQTGTYYRMYQQKNKNSKNANANASRYKYGLYTGPQTRPLIVDALYTCIKEDPGLIKAQRTILELIGLIVKGNGRVEADEGEHDDLSFALGFCAYVKLYDPPIGMATQFMHTNIVDQIVDTVGMNFDNEVFNSEIYGLSTEAGEDSIGANEKSNRLIHNHIKSNLHGMMGQDGSTIDISKILGFNSVTGERSGQYKRRTNRNELEDWEF